MKYLAIISRTIVGIVFTFSGFVKAVDPLGSAYKFEDYFSAFDMPALSHIALPLAFLLAGLEFFIGIGLLFNLFPKVLSWLALIFMAFFTPLTFYLALKNPVTDCGCFGDALVITNWQTFYKNIVLIILAIIIFRYRKNFGSYSNNYLKYGLSTIFILFIFFIMLRGTMHLPILDFRPYKVGNNLSKLMEIPDGAPLDEYIYMYTMKNNVSGAEKTIDSKEYMDSNIWEDTTWVITETSDPILVKEGYHPPIHDFAISSIDGEDITSTILESDTYCLLICYDIKQTNFDNFKEISQLAEKCKTDNIPFIAVTSSNSDYIQQVVQEYHPAFEFYYADETNLKTIIRSNPGLFVLKKGVVAGKWSHRDIPSFEELKKVLQ